MEDNFKFKLNGRRPQFVSKWKTSSICWQLEDDLHFWHMEDKHNFVMFQMEDDQPFCSDPYNNVKILTTPYWLKVCSFHMNGFWLDQLSQEKQSRITKCVNSFRNKTPWTNRLTRQILQKIQSFTLVSQYHIYADMI